MKNYCNNCGNPNENNYGNYCIACGSPLTKDEPSASNIKTKKCPYCKNNIDSKASVCPTCRKQVKTPAIAWMVLIIIVLLMILSCTRININDKGEIEYGSIVYPYPDSMNTIITLKEYNMLEFGMTESEVWNIIGGKCTRIGSDSYEEYIDVSYGCNGSSSTYQMSQATLTFRNGELRFKADLGLE